MPVSLRYDIDPVILRNEGSMFYISNIWILRKLRMTETLVYLLCKCPVTYHAFIRPESHIGSLRCESLLVLHDMDDIM